VIVYLGIPLLLTSAALQSMWLERLHLLGGRPDLVLLIVLSWGVMRGLQEGMLWAFVGGLCLDALSAAPFGLWTVTLTILAFIANQPWMASLGPTVIRLTLIGLIGTLLAHGMLILLGSILGLPLTLQDAFNRMLASAVLNLILAPFVYRFLHVFHVAFPA